MGRGSRVEMQWKCRWKLRWRTSYFTLADTWSAWHISNSPRCWVSDQGGGYLRSERGNTSFWRSECKWSLQRDRLSVRCGAVQCGSAVCRQTCHPVFMMARKRLNGSLTWKRGTYERISCWWIVQRELDSSSCAEESFLSQSFSVFWSIWTLMTTGLPHVLVFFERSFGRSCHPGWETLDFQKLAFLCSVVVMQGGCHCLLWFFHL